MKLNQTEKLETADRLSNLNNGGGSINLAHIGEDAKSLKNIKQFVNSAESLPKFTDESLKSFKTDRNFVSETSSKNLCKQRS